MPNDKLVNTYIQASKILEASGFREKKYGLFVKEYRSNLGYGHVERTIFNVEIALEDNGEYSGEDISPEISSFERDELPYVEKALGDVADDIDEIVKELDEIDFEEEEQ